MVETDNCGPNTGRKFIQLSSQGKLWMLNRTHKGTQYFQHLHINVSFYKDNYF